MANDENKQFIFNWKIENYNLCYSKFGDVLQSPEFTAETLFGTRWFLELYPKGKDETSKEYCSCFLHRSDIDARVGGMNVEYSLEIINANGKSLMVNKEKKLFENGNVSGWPKFCKISDRTEDTLIICCKMRNLEEKSELATECDAKTNFEVEQYTFPWDIEIKDQTDWSESKSFTLSDTSQYEIILSTAGGQLMVHISPHGEHFSSRLIYCKILLLNSEGKQLNSKSEARYFESIDDGMENWKFPFVHLNPMDGKLLKLMFEISSSNKCYSSIENYNYGKLPATDFLIPDDTYADLLHDLHTLFITKQHSDINLKVQDVMIPAHKAVLASRSPVFHTMFNQNMLENQTAKVDITDSDPKTMNLFLQFLYTGNVDVMDHENALNLLMMANKYQVSSLKEKCVSFLMTILSIENVCEILSMAELIEHKRLKKCAIDYIISNSRIILPSYQWHKWITSNFELGIAVMCDISENFGLENDKTSKK